ncbi:MAG TPA: ABC transporter permease subunit [Candidatus Anoxymicrobiaceae bacterium]|jgi:polar amino acid transport system permease protein
MDEGLDVRQYGEPVSEFENPDISGWAKASLIMGILGLTVIPVVGAVLAIVFARIAKKQILRTDLGGDGLATAGQTLGIIGLVLVVFAVYVIINTEGLRKFIHEFFDMKTLGESIPKLARGFIITLELAVISEFFILIFGLLVALLRISKVKFFRFVAAVYIDVIRGLPLILQIFIIYFGLTYLGLNFSRFAAGVVSLTVCYAAYEAEIFRAGIESIHKGQMEASRSLGMTYLQSMRYVVLPQAVRRVIPPLSNEFIMLTKDTALVAFIGLSEVFLVGKEIMGKKFVIAPLVGVALFFLLVTIPMMRGVQYLEKRLARGD